MSETLNLPKLIMRLASEAGCDPAEARRFLHRFFAEIEDSLLEGENITIKGIGTFCLSEDAAHPIKYLADEELAAIANEPFAAFSAVELNDDVTEEELNEDEIPQPEPEPEQEPQPEPEPEPEPEPQPEPQPEPEPQPQPQPQPEEPVEEVAEEPADEVYDEEDDDDAQPSPRHGLWLTVGILIGLIAGLVIGFFAGQYMPQLTSDQEEILIPADTTTAIEEPIATPVIDTVPVAPAEPVAEPEPVATPAPSAEVFDTVSNRRFLTTMARDHYGKKNYWVFIYQANPSLGDPNRIAPGTRLSIPPRSSFEEDTEAATDAKAQRLLNELSQKYKF